MRALVGAVVGLVAGATIVGLLDVSMAGKAFWSVVVAGLAAGFAMRSLAGGSGSAYLKGALAAVATGLAAVGGPIAATQWFTSQSQAAPLQGEVIVEAVAEDDDGPATDEIEVAVEEPLIIAAEPAGPLSNVSLKRPGANNSTVRDTVCLVIGCLLAYQMGKGEGATAPTSEEEAGEGEAAADPGDEPAAEMESDGEGEAN